MKKIFGITLLTLSLFAPLLVSTQVEEIKASSEPAIRANEALDTDSKVVDTFDNGFNHDNWYISKRVWGENEKHDRFNGGVIPDNVYYGNGEVKFLARGNYYAKNEVQGVGTIKDGSLTGGALISKFIVSPGRYEIKMKVAPSLGVCNAFWLYTEDYQSRNHELDFELPGWSSENYLSYDQIVCSSWLGESNHTKTDAKVSTNAADGEYHTYIFDWYYSSNNKCVDYYYDGVLIASHTTNIPFYQNRIWIGAWIPNNADFVGTPNFDTSLMSVDYVSYTPFKNQNYTSNNPYVSLDQVGDERKYPIVENIQINNKFPNGDFSYLTNRDENYTKTGQILTGTYDFKQSDFNNYHLSLTNGKLTTEIDTIIPNHNYSFNAIYKGQGEIGISFLDHNKNVLLTNNTTLENKNTFSYSGDITYKAPRNSYYVNIQIQGNNLEIDDICFEKYISQPDVVESGSCYVANLIENNNIPVTGNNFAFNQTINFDGNKQHPWIISGYKKRNNESSTSLGFYSEEANANQIKESSISNYTGNDELSNIYKQLYKNSIQFNDPATFYTQALIMDYDISEFNDITFYINSRNECVNWQPYMIHYSIDNGLTWKYLKHTFGKNLVNENINDIYQYALSANIYDIVEEFETIRFAFTLTAYGSVNSQVIKLGGIVINNFNGFINFINGNTCNLSNSDLDMLEVLYAKLKDDEVSLIKKNNLTNYPKTYYEAYQEILSRYSSIQNKGILTNENSLITIIIIVSVALFTFTMLYIKNKRRFKL